MQSFIIALHTIVFIVWRYKVPNKAAIATVPVVWAIVIIMTSVGPIHVRVLRQNGRPEAGPFYNSAGLWCWIGLEYEPWRVYNHYLFVFLSAFGSLTMYTGVFLYLWFRLFQKGVYNHQLFQLRRAADGRLVPTSATPVVDSQPTFRGDGNDEEKANATDSLAVPAADRQGRTRHIKQRIKDQHAADRNRKVDRAALLMLLFPACYILSILPLATYRLARISHQPWSYNLDVQAGCGFLFALGGTFNAILYALTRKIFQSSGKGSSSPYASANATASRSGMHQTGTASGAQMYQIDLAQDGPAVMDKTRKASHSGSIGTSSQTSSFPAGVDVGGKTSPGAWQPSAMLFGRARKVSTDSGRRPSADYARARMPSMDSRPSIHRKPSGLGQAVHFASGHRGKARDDGTWDDGLSFEDSTDAGESVYELSREEQEAEHKEEVPSDAVGSVTAAPILESQETRKAEIVSPRPVSQSTEKQRRADEDVNA